MKNPKKKIRITIGGYYGSQSLGDDTILRALIMQISESIPSCKIDVISRGPVYIPLTCPLEISFISAKNPFSILFSLIRSRVYISGGGSLLQDVTSSLSLLYYTFIIRAARLLFCKVFIMANGIGPLKNEKRAQKALRAAHRISVRDPDSLALAKKLCPEKEIYLSADPVFSGYPPKPKRLSLPSCLTKLDKKPFFALSLRKCEGMPKIDLDSLSLAVSLFQREGYTPVYVPMQDSYDLKICMEMQRRNGGIVFRTQDMESLYLLLEKADFAIGMRLHFLLCCAIAKTPCVALSYDCKVKSAMDYLELDNTLCAFSFSPKELYRKVKKVKQLFDPCKLEEKCRSFSDLCREDILSLSSLIEDTHQKERSPGEILQ